LKSVTVEEGETVVLSTQVVGNPTPKVTWLKNGKPVTDQPTHQDGDTYTLTLLEPAPQDTAQYTVQAKNSAGFAESTATVVIEGNQLVFVCKHILSLNSHWYFSPTYSELESIP
jgi:hypothetical protein